MSMTPLRTMQNGPLIWICSWSILQHFQFSGVYKMAILMGVHPIQWWIQDFPGGSANPKGGGNQLFGQFSQKMREMKTFWWRGGVQGQSRFYFYLEIIVCIFRCIGKRVDRFPGPPAKFFTGNLLDVCRFILNGVKYSVIWNALDIFCGTGCAKNSNEEIYTYLEICNSIRTVEV